VTPVLAGAATQEWEWARAWTDELVRFVSADAVHGEANRAVIDGWVAEWEPLAVEAAAALGADMSAERVPDVAPKVVPASRPTRRVRPVAARRAVAAEGNGDEDYVGIVMAKSAEGDAVADVLGRRDGVEVIEQPAFWDVRARGRLSIPYDEVSEALGYDVDAYSIQHEMSTHYGRMVATDDTLMLFSDPTEAMQYLMS
jgi:hypothetical protein